MTELWKQKRDQVPYLDDGDDALSPCIEESEEMTKFFHDHVRVLKKSGCEE